jgi:Ca2+-binding RTX toxin-like protein
MIRRILLPLAGAAAALALVMTSASALPPTELTGSGPTPIPLKNKAMIIHTEWGYRMIIGQQNSDLTITEVDGGLRFEDPGTEKWRTLPGSCDKQSVAQGVAAVCSIPAAFSGDTKMFIEVWPRLGNDVVDGSTLSAKYRLWVLTDKGNDTVYVGAGDSFVNGAQGNDKIYGGPGDDWLRMGKGTDQTWGGDGVDKIVGQNGHDLIHGGAGDDLLYGAFGPDTIWGDGGADSVVCGGGDDTAYLDAEDNNGYQCESTSRTS